MSAPLVIDLFCGRFGWSRGFVAAGWRSIGFDIERMIDKIPDGCELVLQDVCTLHGAQFRAASMIVASSPCQEFSYRAMPWKRAKALPPPHEGKRLFEQAFRLQREASEAADRHIPMVCENVKGAQPWIGAARAHFGSYYLWGDIGTANGQIVAPHRVQFGAFLPAPSVGGRKGPGGDWFANGRQGQDACALAVGVKQRGSGPEWFDKGIAKHSSRSDSRKAASAAIAEIPFDLAFWIAKVFHP